MNESQQHLKKKRKMVLRSMTTVTLMVERSRLAVKSAKADVVCVELPEKDLNTARDIFQRVITNVKSFNFSGSSTTNHCTIFITLLVNVIRR